MRLLLLSLSNLCHPAPPQVPHRTIYPDATRSEWIVKNTGQERSCRVYRLLDPTISVREALEEADDDNDPDADGR